MQLLYICDHQSLKVGVIHQGNKGVRGSLLIDTNDEAQLAKCYIALRLNININEDGRPVI